MRKEKMLKEIIDNREKLSKLYKVSVADEINMKKFNVAQALYAPNIYLEDVLCMIDTTLFGNGKNGVILTTNGYYSRELGDNYTFNFDEVEGLTLSNDNKIIVKKNDGSILSFRNIIDKSCIDVYRSLLDIYKTTINTTSVSAVSEERKKLMDFIDESEKETIKNMISDLYTSSSIYEVNQIKLANAINAFSPRTDRRNVFAFLDFSIFGSGKEGLIFENDKLTFKYLNTKFTFFYRDFSEMHVLHNTNTKEITRIAIVYNDNSFNHIEINDMPFTDSNKLFIFSDILKFIKMLYKKYEIEKYEDTELYFESTMDLLLKRYQTSLATGAVHLGDGIDKERFDKAKKVYAKNAIWEQTYLLAESNLIGNSRNGCIITFWGIYSREYGEDVVVYFSDIEDIDADEDHLYITLKNGTKTVVSNGIFYENQLCSLLKGIIYFYSYYVSNTEKYNLKRSKYNYLEMIKSFDETYDDKEVEWINNQILLGNPKASIELANRYRFGNGIEKDIDKSIEILNSLQSAVANRILGEIYYTGDSVEKDTKLAEKYFKRASKLGDLEAEVWLANYDFLGVNREVNYDRAFTRYKELVDKIEENKLPMSLKSNIGLCYRFGYGCNKDYIKAEYWLKNAINADSYFKYLIAELYVDKEEFAEKLNEGIVYLEELVNKGYAKAMAKLGELYFVGRNVEIDHVKAYDLLKQSSELGDFQGEYYFGIFTILNNKDNLNYEDAFLNISKSADKLYPPAVRDLGIMYQYGIGTNKDISKAKIYFDNAAELGDEYSKEWREHTKKFLNRIKLMNSCIDSNIEFEFDTNEDINLIWDPLKEKNICGLHKVIFDYPLLVKSEIVDKNIKELKVNKDAFVEASKLGTNVFSAASTANITKNFNTFFQRQGHGTAAEYAGHVSDLLKFKNAKWLGTDNALNGADRSVNGQLIQTKFCKDYSTLKQSCVENGQYKYIDKKTGKPMMLEVANDKKSIEAAERMMTELFGEDGKSLIKVSKYSTKQAQNIAKFGNIDSLVVDSKLGIVNARNAMGITMAISYATSLINGDNMEDATNKAIQVGVNTFGITFASTVISAQLSKTSIVKGVEVSNKLVGDGVRKVLTRATMGNGSKTMSQTMAKNLVKSNIVTSIATTAVLSSADIARLISGRISKEQLCKNVSVTAAGVAGGSAGYYAGAAVGSFILPIPVVGTFVGGLVGASIAGMTTGNIVGMTLDQFIKNDGDQMIEIFNNVLREESENYLLSVDEINYVIDRIQESDILTAKGLRDIYASDDREMYCTKLIIPIVEEVCEIRPFIITPKDDDIYEYVEEYIDAEII